MGLSAVLSLALAACGGSGSTATPAASAAPAPRRRVPRPARPAAPAGAACAESATAGTVKVSIENFAFDPAAITAKVGDTVTFTNGDSAGHTATLDDGSCFTPTIASGTERRPDVHGRRDVPVPLRDPLDDEGHDHRQLSPAGDESSGAAGVRRAGRPPRQLD